MSRAFLSEATKDELRRLHRPVERMTLSLPPDLAEWLRAAATEADVPVSHVVEYALRKRREETGR